jgi:hypothetical protein
MYYDRVYFLDDKKGTLSYFEYKARDYIPDDG